MDIFDDSDEEQVSSLNENEGNDSKTEPIKYDDLVVGSQNKPSSEIPNKIVDHPRIYPLPPNKPIFANFLSSQPIPCPPFMLNPQPSAKIGPNKIILTQPVLPVPIPPGPFYKKSVDRSSQPCTPFTLKSIINKDSKPTEIDEKSKNQLLRPLLPITGCSLDYYNSDLQKIKEVFKSFLEKKSIEQELIAKICEKCSSSDFAQNILGVKELYRNQNLRFLEPSQFSTSEVIRENILNSLKEDKKNTESELGIVSETESFSDFLRRHLNSRFFSRDIVDLICSKDLSRYSAMEILGIPLDMRLLKLKDIPNESIASNEVIHENINKLLRSSEENEAQNIWKIRNSFRKILEKLQIDENLIDQISDLAYSTNIVYNILNVPDKSRKINIDRLTPTEIGKKYDIEKNIINYINIHLRKHSRLSDIKKSEENQIKLDLKNTEKNDDNKSSEKTKEDFKPFDPFKSEEKHKNFLSQMKEKNNEFLDTSNSIQNINIRPELSFKEKLMTQGVSEEFAEVLAQMNQSYDEALNLYHVNKIIDSEARHSKGSLEYYKGIPLVNGKIHISSRVHLIKPSQTPSFPKENNLKFKESPKPNTTFSHKANPGPSQVFSAPTLPVFTEKMKPYSFTYSEFSHFSIHSDSSYLPPSLVSRLQQESKQLSSDLPCSSNNSIFVVSDSRSISRMKVLISGAESTPFAYGLYLFDLFIPPSYPNTPPIIKILTASGAARFSPNLFSCGNVCMSLLNTESRGNRWDSAKSSIWQLVVSIQSLIMSENFLEFEDRDCSEVEKESFRVEIQYSNLKYAILEMIRNPPKEAEDLVKEYFLLQERSIMETARKWREEVINFSSVKGIYEENNGIDQEINSLGAKVAFWELINELEEEFKILKDN